MRWVSVFSNYQEVKSSALVLFLFYVPGIYYVLKKVVMSFFVHFCFFLIIRVLSIPCYRQCFVIILSE